MQQNRADAGRRRRCRGSEHPRGSWRSRIARATRPDAPIDGRVAGRDLDRARQPRPGDVRPHDRHVHRRADDRGRAVRRPPARRPALHVDRTRPLPRRARDLAVRRAGPGRRPGHRTARVLRRRPRPLVRLRPGRAGARRARLPRSTGACRCTPRRAARRPNAKSGSGSRARSSVSAPRTACASRTLWPGSSTACSVSTTTWPSTRRRGRCPSPSASPRSSSSSATPSGRTWPRRPALVGDEGTTSAAITRRCAPPPSSAGPVACRSGRHSSRSSERWRRFLITDASPADRPDTTSDDRSLALDVTLLGRDARADRVRHHVDAATVHALVDHLGANTADRPDGDGRSTSSSSRSRSRASSRPRRPCSSSSMPSPRTSRGSCSRCHGPAAPTCLAECGAVMRQFAEREDRRLNPDRASVGDALVIAAGQGAGADARAARRVRGGRPRRVELLGRRARRRRTSTRSTTATSRSTRRRCRTRCSATTSSCTSPATASTSRTGPGETGAVLSSTSMLTVDHVRELAPRARRRVPQLLQPRPHRHDPHGRRLAREFMAIGTRAVVAAGGRSTTPRHGVRGHLLPASCSAGRPLGDAVARAG